MTFNAARFVLGISLGAVLAACPGPDLGVAPFFCHKGNPQCPEGYTCRNVGKQELCIKEGETPPPPDGAQPNDSGPVPDGRRDQRPGTDGPPPTLPKIAITEFMANPKVVTDTEGEWLELFNPGTQGVDINGWTLKDLGTDLHKIQHTGALVVPPKGYLLIGRSTDKLLNGGVNVAYAFKDFYLSNTEDEITLLDDAGKTVENFTYGVSKGFVIPDGASLSVKHPGADKNLPASWCAETKVWTGSKGDKGTPGGNPGC